MEFFKRNGSQPLTLVLCAVLIGMVWKQGEQVRQLEEQLDGISWRVDDLQERAISLSRKVAESEKQISDHTLTPTGLDAGTRSLLAEASVTLKEWRADTQVTLVVTAGAETREFPMTQRSDGGFIASVAIPVEEREELQALSLVINNDGTIRREELGGWNDLTTLLPVQLVGYGGSKPVYRNGTLSQSSFSVDVNDIGQVGMPVFRLYRNDELVWEERAKKADDQLECPAWSIPYETRDKVEFTFACRDPYGLGYEFPLEFWSFDGETPLSQGGMFSSGGTFIPRLTWE